MVPIKVVWDLDPRGIASVQNAVIVKNTSQVFPAGKNAALIVARLWCARVLSTKG